MDAVEFAKTMRKICRSHTNCVECEFMKVQGHCCITNPEADHAGMVAVAEQWAREHVEKATEEESRNMLELMVALTDKVDRLAEKIKVAENMIEESRCVTDAAFGEVNERFAEVDKRIALCTQENNGKTKKKRTRKDLMLAAFPDTEVLDGHPPFCPIHFEKGYTCRDATGGIPCNNCKREYWLTEVEG